MYNKVVGVRDDTIASFCDYFSPTQYFKKCPSQEEINNIFYKDSFSAVNSMIKSRGMDVTDYQISQEEQNFLALFQEIYDIQQLDARTQVVATIQEELFDGQGGLGDVYLDLARAAKLLFAERASSNVPEEDKEKVKKEDKLYDYKPCDKLFCFDLLFEDRKEDSEEVGAGTSCAYCSADILTTAQGILANIQNILGQSLLVHCVTGLHGEPTATGSAAEVLQKKSKLNIKWVPMPLFKSNEDNKKENTEEGSEAEGGEAAAATPPEEQEVIVKAIKAYLRQRANGQEDPSPLISEMTSTDIQTIQGSLNYTAEQERETKTTEAQTILEQEALAVQQDSKDVLQQLEYLNKYFQAIASSLANLNFQLYQEGGESAGYSFNDYGA